MTLLDRLLRRTTMPPWLGPLLAADERVLASASMIDGVVVATSHGIWLPERRRVGWHLVSKASWDDGALCLVEAEAEPIDGAELLTDLPVRRLALAEPGRLPEVVRERVEASIRSRHHRDLGAGGMWFVQRKVPGQDGVRLQVRPDPGTDERVVRRLAAEVVAALPRGEPP